MLDQFNWKYFWIDISLDLPAKIISILGIIYCLRRFRQLPKVRLVLILAFLMILFEPSFRQLSYHYLDSFLSRIPQDPRIGYLKTTYNYKLYYALVLSFYRSAFIGCFLWSVNYVFKSKSA